MCVHHCTWHFNGPHKVEVVVAQMVCKFLNLLLLHCGCVLNNKVMNWQGCSDCGSVCNHVEVKATISVHWAMFDKACVDNSTWSWVCIAVSLFLNKSSVDLFVDKCVKELGVIVSLE